MKSKLWKLVLATVVVLVAVCVYWLSSPLPPPAVSLRFQGFKPRGTNIYAAMCITNEGQKMIWWTHISWKAEIETESGWMTNWAVYNTTVPAGIRPKSNYIFYVDIPSNAISWRVSDYYGHYERHNLRMEFADKLLSTHVWERAPQPFWEAAFWCLRLLPEPPEQVGEVATPFLTNRPPIQSSASASGVR